MDCRRYETGPLLPCIIHIVASFITSSHQQEKSLWWSWTHHEYFKRSCFMHQPWTFGLAILHFWQNTRLDKQRLKFVGNRGLFCMRLFCHVTKTLDIWKCNGHWCRSSSQRMVFLLLLSTPDWNNRVYWTSFSLKAPPLLLQHVTFQATSLTLIILDLWGPISVILRVEDLSYSKSEKKNVRQ